MRDVTFVAIDFENLGNIKQDSAQNLESQVGIARSCLGSEAHAEREGEGHGESVG